LNNSRSIIPKSQPPYGFSGRTGIQADFVEIRTFFGRKMCFGSQNIPFQVRFIFCD